MKFICWLREGFGTVAKALCVALLICQAAGGAQSQVDRSFHPALDGPISSMALQVDGKIVLGGGFTTVNGSARPYLARLNTDGSVDTSFNPTNGPAQFVSRVLVMDSQIYVAAGDGLRRFSNNGVLEWHYPMSAATFAVDSQGRVIFGGHFIRIEGQYHRNIARLTAAGVLDASFSAAIGCCAGEGVDALATQGDSVLVGGLFQSVNGTHVASHLVRLAIDGSVDGSFSASAAPRVSALVTTPDGKLFQANQQTLVRHLASGAIDSTFAPVSAGGSSDDRFVTVVVAPEGKPIVGGNFTLDGGATRSYVARFESDGSLDSSFAVASDGPVQAIAVQADGGILIGGIFTSVNGVPCPGIARIAAPGSAPVTPALDIARCSSGSLVLSWPQSADSFVVESAHLNDNTWSPIGAATVVAGGKNFVTNPPVGAGKLFRLRARP